MTITTGDRLVLTTDRFAYYSAPIYSTVTAEADEAFGEVRATTGSGRVLYVLTSEVVVDDPLTMPLPVYKAWAMRQMWKAKAEYGWCGSAEYVARSLGLASYLPTPLNVTRTQIVNAVRWPGETDDAVIRRARRAEDESAWYSVSHEIADEVTTEADDYPADVQDESPEAFRARLKDACVDAAREYAVAGVPDFLRSVGIECDVITRPVNVSVTISVPVEIEVGTEAYEAEAQAREEIEGAGYSVVAAYAD